MPQSDDIYKKDSVPRFARRKYKKSHMGSVDRHPEVASNSRRSTGSIGDRSGPSRFEGRMQGQSRSRSGGRGKSGGSRRSSRTTEGSKTNIIIIGVLLVAVAVYAGILGYVRLNKGSQSVAYEGPEETGPTPPAEGQAAPSTTATGSEEAAPEGELISEVEVGVPMEMDKPVDQMIAELKNAYKEIKAVDTPLNTAPAEQSIARLEKQIAITPHLLDLKMELARRYVSNAQYPEAAAQLSEILSAEPHNITARKLLADSFVEGEDYNNAILVAKWILEEDKFSTEARNILANCYMRTGNYPRAIDHLRALAGENSLDVITQNNLGVAHSRMKRYDLAIPIFEKTIRIDKSNAVGYYNLAICHAQRNTSQKACDVIYKASEQFGPAFVAQWINAKEFAPIAQTPPFERLKSRFGSYVSDTSTPTTVLMQKEEEPKAPFGKASLPKFDINEK